MGKRADPGSSMETARRHLFRHFHDVKELRRNPLCAAFFQAARAQRRPAPDHAAMLNVHRTIRKIVEDYERSTMGEPDSEPLRRQLALFKAYVFEQRAWEELAGELGLSRRQFFRDYACVRDRILESFTQWGPGAQAGQWLEADAVVLAEAGLLIQASMVDEAVKRLRATMAADTPAHTRAKAVCMLARLAMEDARYKEAESLLQAAVEGTDAPDVRAEAGVLNTYLEWYSCGTARAQCIPPADRLAYDRNNPGISTAYLHMLICQTMHTSWLGDYGQAYRIIQRAKALLDADCNASLEDRLAVAGLHAIVVASLSPQNVPQAINLLSEAMDLALKNRLVRSSLPVAVSLGMCQVITGDMEAARSLFDRCMKVSESLNDRGLRVTTAIDLGDPSAVGAESAITRLEWALPFLPEADWRAPTVHLFLAVARAQLGQQERTLADLENAKKAASHCANPRSMGAILRELAAAQYHRGEKRRAKETIGDAVAVLERHGNAYSLAKAYHTYAYITGDQRFVQKAAAL